MKDVFHLKDDANISETYFIHSENLLIFYIVLIIANENASLAIFVFKKIENE